MEFFRCQPSGWRWGSPARICLPVSANHAFGRGAFRIRLKEDRKDLWTKRK